MSAPYVKDAVGQKIRAGDRAAYLGSGCRRPEVREVEAVAPNGERYPYLRFKGSTRQVAPYNVVLMSEQFSDGCRPDALANPRNVAEQEGFHRAFFECDSTFQNVDDEKFQRLRADYVRAGYELAGYLGLEL